LQLNEYLPNYWSDEYPTEVNFGGVWKILKKMENY